MHIGDRIISGLTSIVGGKQKAPKDTQGLKEAGQKELNKPEEAKETTTPTLTRTTSKKDIPNLKRGITRSTSLAAIKGALTTTTSKIESSIKAIKKEGATEAEINSAIEEIKELALSKLPKNASEEEKTKAIMKELTYALKELVPPNKFLQANRLVSFALGQAILQPKSFEGKNELVEKCITKAFEKPGYGAEDMWRSVERMKIYSSTSTTAILDGKNIRKDDEDLPVGEDLSTMMANTLNLFYQHVSKSHDTLLSAAECGNSQQDAGKIGNGLADRLTNKGMEEKQATSLQRMLGLGAQELFNQPARQSIPEGLQDGRSTPGNKLIISEYNSVFESQVEPLQYEREISIRMKEDGGVDYVVQQPITFKDKNAVSGDPPLGTCRVQTTFSFNANMECVSQKQEVLAAEILQP
ncbi:MAG: hypothetical protein JSR46_11775 [Verrucomicrobia bacterium]|nr:hypothetical protein [Verrucomicrobiota bacterium]